MTFLSILGYIVLFILCLSVLIVVHEAGHFAMAKAFNVYCLDFSIGFGPALFHKKRKMGKLISPLEPSHLVVMSPCTAKEWNYLKE